MMGRRVVTTSRGVVVEGRLVVLAEENDGLIFIGEEFLDDVLRERFAAPSRAEQAPSQGAPVEVEHVRIVVEMTDPIRDRVGSGPASDATSEATGNATGKGTSDATGALYGRDGCAR